MANYAVTDLTTASCKSIEEAMAALEVLMETIDNTKTIYYVDLIEQPNAGRYMGVIIHQA